MLFGCIQNSNYYKRPFSNNSMTFQCGVRKLVCNEVELQLFCQTIQTIVTQFKFKLNAMYLYLQEMAQNNIELLEFNLYTKKL